MYDPILAVTSDSIKYLRQRWGARAMSTRQVVALFNLYRDNHGNSVTGANKIVCSSGSSTF